MEESTADVQMVDANVHTEADRAEVAEIDEPGVVNHMVEMIDLYLQSQPYVLWANWDITIPGRRKLAAEWLAEQLLALDNFMDEYYAKHPLEDPTRSPTI